MKHIVSFSGGKDSSAMLLRMIELKMPIDEIVFADTTLEFPEMYEWINKIEELINMKITRLKPLKSFNDWFYGKCIRGKSKGNQRGFPLTAFPCYWSRESKFKLLDPICKGNIRYLGIAVDEPKRIHLKEGYKYPLVDWNWTEQDCINYLEKRGLKHPLFKFKRTGCWLCPKQSKGSLKILMEDYPELWEKLKKYEEDSPNGFKPNFSLEEFENSYSF